MCYRNSLRHHISCTLAWKTPSFHIYRFQNKQNIRVLVAKRFFRSTLLMSDSILEAYRDQILSIPRIRQQIESFARMKGAGTIRHEQKSYFPCRYTCATYLTFAVYENVQHFLRISTYPVPMMLVSSGTFFCQSPNFSFKKAFGISDFSADRFISICSRIFPSGQIYETYVIFFVINAEGFVDYVSCFQGHITICHIFPMVI